MTRIKEGMAVRAVKDSEDKLFGYESQVRRGDIGVVLKDYGWPDYRYRVLWDESQREMDVDPDLVASTGEWRGLPEPDLPVDDERSRARPSSDPVDISGYDLDDRDPGQESVDISGYDLDDRRPAQHINLDGPLPLGLKLMTAAGLIIIVLFCWGLWALLS